MRGRYSCGAGSRPGPSRAGPCFGPAHLMLIAIPALMLIPVLAGMVGPLTFREEGTDGFPMQERPSGAVAGADSSAGSEWSSGHEAVRASVHGGTRLALADNGSGEGAVVFLEDPAVSRSKVEKGNKVTFSVVYRQTQNLRPLYVMVSIDGTPFPMEKDEGALWEHGVNYTITRSMEKEGRIPVFFTCMDRDGNRADTSRAAFNISVEGKDGDGPVLGETGEQCLLLSVVMLFVMTTTMFVISVYSRSQREKLLTRGKGGGIVCPSCGEVADEGTTFCPRCGGRYPGELVKCHYCGEPVDGNLERCSHCNSRLPGDDEDGPDPGRASRRPARGVGATGKDAAAVTGGKGRGAGKRGSDGKRKGSGARKGGSGTGDDPPSHGYDEILTCTECGAVVSENMSTCPGCGETFEETVEGDAPARDDAGARRGEDRRARSAIGRDATDPGLRRKPGERERDELLGRASESGLRGTGADFLCSVCGCPVSERARQCPKCGNRFL